MFARVRPICERIYRQANDRFKAADESFTRVHTFLIQYKTNATTAVDQLIPITHIRPQT